MYGSGHSDKNGLKHSAFYLLRCPLESSHNRVLDFVKVLHSLCAIDQDVGAGGVGAEAPDLSGLGDVVFVLVGQVATTDLKVLLGSHFALK